MQIPNGRVSLAEYYARFLPGVPDQATIDALGTMFITANDPFHLVGGVLVAGSLPPS